MRFFIAAAFACAFVPSSASALSAALDEAALRQRLLRLPPAGSRTVDIVLPDATGGTRTFHIRDSDTLPRGLVKRFPGLRSFRGEDDDGRTLRLDLSPAGIRASLRSGASEWLVRPGGTWTREPEGFVPAAGSGASEPAPTPAPPDPPVRTRRSAPHGGLVRHDFRLAVAASSRYVAKTGGTVAESLAEITHMVNRANQVFETDLGVHFTLVERNDRIVRATARGDIFETHEPGPAAVRLIDREIGPRNYDIGHALSVFEGGDSHVGTSCSDARDADFFATHKAAAWSGHADPAGSSLAFGYFIHVLGRQLGAWPTANGCRRITLDDTAAEPGGGSTVMSYATPGCGDDGHWLQPRSDLYFHARSIDQIQAWLGSRGGRCASKRLTGATAPWVDPEPLAERTVIPARTPFMLDAAAKASQAGRRLSYTWEQMDTGPAQRGELQDSGEGPLFRSFPPSPDSTRLFPRLAAVLGHEPAEPGETLPTTSRQLNFRVTVREQSEGDGSMATQASADTRIRVVDTGRPFRLTAPDAAAVGVAGGSLDVLWDVAGTTEAPISCHFVDIDLSTDGGMSWAPSSLAQDERNDGKATVTLPPDIATDRARLRVRCDWRPFLAVSAGDFVIRLP